MKWINQSLNNYLAECSTKKKVFLTPQRIVLLGVKIALNTSSYTFRQKSTNYCISVNFLHLARTAMRILITDCWSLLAHRRITNDSFWQLSSIIEVIFWVEFSFQNAKTLLQVNFSKLIMSLSLRIREIARRSETPYLSPPVVMIYKLSTSRRSKSPDLLLFAHKTTNVRITFLRTVEHY